MNRAQATEAILAKRNKGISYTDIARSVGVDRVWLTAALHGQHPFDADTAQRVRDVLDLPEDVVPVLREVPMRGCLDSTPPTDPTIYRLHEVLQVYGTALKALIHEDFGDGIMSAITFRLDVQRVDTVQGPRVRIVWDGKFLPYQW